MYEEFYGLRERPFDLTPNPRFLFMTAGHREALTTIEYGIAGRKGITLLVGPAGTGKTTLVHLALGRQRARQNATALYLKNPRLTRDEFLQFLASGFGLSPEAARSKTHLLRELEALLEQRHAAGMVTALIVDEGQTMTDALLDELRLLANIETPTDKLLPVVLVGQPELAERLNERPLLQLKQRLALRAKLAPLSRDETVDYIAERVRVAGGDVHNVFSPEAMTTIFRGSGGIPRTISVVCDNALVSGFALDQRPVGRDVILEVCRDFDLQAAPADAPLPSSVRMARSTVPAVRASAAPAKPERLVSTPSSLVFTRSVASAVAVVEPPSGPHTRQDDSRPVRDPASRPAPASSAPRWRGFRSLFERTAAR
jgi:general secretion pathway protein A